MEKDLNEGNEEGEYQVDVYHLEIGGWRQTVGDVDEQSGQHKHCCQVDSHDGLEEESFEVVGGVADHVEENLEMLEVIEKEEAQYLPSVRRW